MTSSILSTYATQSLLAAVGVVGRASRSPLRNQVKMGVAIGNSSATTNTARAAAFSWVMKDGLGRLGRFFVAASLGDSCIT